MEAGQRLSEARRRRNLTVADIARTTRIPAHFLEAIERGDVARMPPGFFARAFVRTYAKEVGIDPADVLERVDETVSAEPEPNVPLLPPTVDAAVSTRHLLWIIPVAALCGIYYVGLGTRDTRSVPPQPSAREQAQAADRVEPVAAARPETQSDVELHIQSRGGCIVAVTADGNAISPQGVPSGQPLLLKARGEVVLRVGDSDACAPSVKPDSVARSPRRPRIDTVPPPPVAITHAVDQASPAAAPVAEPVPGASDVSQPESPDQPAAPPTAEQF